MNKEFLPYEQALELKELGFDEPCFGFFTSLKQLRRYTNFDGELNEFQSLKNSNIDMGNEWCTAPTFSQAFRWFREKYGLRIRNYGSINYSGGLSEYFEIFKYGYGTSDKSLSIEIGALTYEEAELECLKKLIEIVKQTK